MKDDMFVLLVHVLGGKICEETILKPTQIQIITRTLVEAFVTKLTEKFGKMMCGSTPKYGNRNA
jgi:hypothetical protein